MAGINEKDFTSELKFCIAQKDIVKAKALLQYLPQVSEKGQTLVLYEISKSEPPFAFLLLEYISGITIDSEKIAHRVYHLIIDKAYGNLPLLLASLEKTELKTPQLFIRAAGDLEAEEAVPALMELLATHSDTAILKAILRALGAIGAPAAISSVAEFIYYGNEELKREAIYALSEAGGPSAIHRLAEAITGTSKTDQLLIEALGEIQSQQALTMLCGMINSRYVDIRNFAMDLLIEIGPKAVPVVSENLNTADTDCLIHTLNILGNIGDPTSVSGIHKLLRKSPADSNVRYAAYEALGRLPSTKSAMSLARGIQDPAEQVRLAASRALDRNLSPLLVTGLKNMLGSEEQEARALVATLVDSEADNTVRLLLSEPRFRALAAEHLSQNAHPDIRAHFLTLFEKIGEKDLAEEVLRHAGEEATADKLTIFVVDDSKMMLRLYMTKLHQMGYTPVTFEFPAKAIEAIAESKPDLVITDLNMPEINGVQLTEQIRSLFSTEELPIIMITTQSDFVGLSSSARSARIDEIAMKRAGIDRVLHKPFRDEELSAAIHALKG